MNNKQSRAGWIREHLQEIDGRLELGIRRAVIVAELQSLGYNCSAHELSNDLSRARRWAKSKVAEAPAAIAPPLEATSVAEPDATAPKASASTAKPSLVDKLKKPAGMQFKGTPSKGDEGDLF
jgi:hypothetical protein